ncbi:hypothetical protein PTTG_28828 [Puccinia triticina 1-1 BBBD Race 1]|uniref:Cytochrome c oxidase polypeptide VIIA n=2 Tax=Puccinia triticina TaxID=208348 RepID=A0A180GB04_PUCT1|nr:hypothetical protein PTTG_28828 [Puccinia triticina 1-1 BBBD Race 1]
MAVSKFKAKLLQQILHAFPNAHHHQNSMPVDYCSRIQQCQKSLQPAFGPLTYGSSILLRSGPLPPLPPSPLARPGTHNHPHNNDPSSNPRPNPPRPGPDFITSSGSANLNLTRPAPTRNYIRVGFGHCFPTRTRPGFIPRRHAPIQHTNNHQSSSTTTSHLNPVPNTPPKFVMAIAPITGKLRKRILLDLSVSLGLGTAAAYTWWYGYHVPKMRHQQNVYARINSTRAEQES